MDQQGSSPTATPTRDQRECRNPSCFQWAQAVNDAPSECSSCGWELASVLDTDVALRMPNNQWALADVQDVLATGSEMKMKAWATRLQVKARSHHGISEPSLRCPCGDGFATSVHAADELNEGRCRYCDGTGIITLEIARRQCAMRPGDET